MFYFLLGVASPCGWMLICTVVQAFPALPFKMHLFPHMKTLLFKTLKSGLCRTEWEHLKS